MSEAPPVLWRNARLLICDAAMSRIARGAIVKRGARIAFDPDDALDD